MVNWGEHPSVSGLLKIDGLESPTEFMNIYIELIAMSLLDQLKTMTDVVVDTGDIEMIATYKVMDATTNSSLLFKAAQLPCYALLVQQCIKYVKLGWDSDQVAIDQCMDQLLVATWEGIRNFTTDQESLEQRLLNRACKEAC